MANRVARYQADRTNQKLYFCRIYCQLAKETEVGQLQDAHVESALMHLYGGYLAFLQEISRYYNLTLAKPTLQNIHQALAAKTQISPEIVRLDKLLQNDFLGDIDNAWQQILYKPVPQALQANDQETKIAVLDIMAASPNSNISVDMILQWRGELLNIIERLREGMAEF